MEDVNPTITRYVKSGWVNKLIKTDSQIRPKKKKNPKPPGCCLQERGLIQSCIQADCERKGEDTRGTVP